MKTIIKFWVLFLFAMVTITTNGQTKTKNVKQVVFKCSIDCHSCESKIMQNLPYQKGVKDIKVSLPDQLVTIWYIDSKSNPEVLKQAIEKIGFTASIINTDSTTTN